MKQSWKIQLLKPEAEQVMRTARSLDQAATAIGVHRATLYRWIRDGKVPPLSNRGGGLAALPEGDWAASVRERYDLSGTEALLLELAEEALALARDRTLRPSDRLAAMGRFSKLTKELNLENPNGEVENATARQPWPPRRVG